MCHSGELHVFVAQPINHAIECGGFAHGPGHWGRFQDQIAFDFVEKIPWIATGAIPFVDERHDGHVAFAADLEQSTSLWFDAFTGVEHHDGGIGRGEDPECVFAEVFVTRCVEQV